VKNILEYFPGVPRPAQEFILKQVEKAWDTHDVFVIQAPTATGKSKLALTISAWANNCSIIVPNNVLLDQYTEEVPDLNTLRKRESYWCQTHNRSCEETHKKLGHCCKGVCNYTQSVRSAKWAKVGVYNYYTYLVHRLYRSTLIIDEAHLVIPMLQELAAKKLWKFQYNWPGQMKSIGDILAWIESIAKPDAKCLKLQREIKSTSPATLIKKDWAWWRGKEEREVIKLIPLDTRNERPILWPPNKVRKIVLMSATIGKPDLDNMGLGQKRVKYIQCPSPIPKENRPIIYEPVANMSFKHQETAVPIMAQYVQYLLDQHQDKGLIHCTYSIAQKLYPFLKDEDRLMWHDRDNKKDIYHVFMDSDPEDGRVLVASGLYEGVDLPYEAGRWQLVTKVPYPSMVDAAIKAKMQQDPDWYSWQAIRTILQASGRICRTPTDYGVTYLADSMFEHLFRKHQDLFPEWWIDALVYV
jgi:Rad3-related DNA helicase